MRHGFKAEAERRAVAIRAELGQPPESPLPVSELTKHMGIRLLTPKDIPGMPPDLLSQLLSRDARSWSAMTLELGPNNRWVIYNPMHSRARRESDIMHEIAHLLCEHPPAKLVLNEGPVPIALRDYDALAEEEARWLGGCLQAPRPALIHAIRRGLSNSEIAGWLGASEDMVRYRRGVTGVDRQAQFNKNKRRSWSF